MSKFLHYEPCPKCREKGLDRAGDNLARYSDGGGYCFSCGYRIFSRPVFQLQSKPQEKVNAKVLPADFTREVPLRAWQWLLQYGLSYKYWQPFVGWSEKDQRLIFTVGDPVEFSQGRWFGNGEERRKWHNYGDKHKTAYVFEPQLREVSVEPVAKSLVLVEDLISAHKVGTVVPTIPLFGTRVMPCCYPVLRHYALPILMWLDKDQQQHAVKRAANLSSLTGLPVKYIFTDDDPKSIPLQCIKEIINESRT